MAVYYRITKENKIELGMLWGCGRDRYKPITIYINRHGDIWYQNCKNRIYSEYASLPDTEETRKQHKIITKPLMFLKTKEQLDHFVKGGYFLFAWDKVIVSAKNLLSARHIFLDKIVGEVDVSFLDEKPKILIN